MRCVDLNQTLRLSWTPLQQLEELEGSEEHVAATYRLDVSVLLGWCAVISEESDLVRRKQALKHKVEVGHQVDNSLEDSSGKNILCAIVACFL